MFFSPVSQRTSEMQSVLYGLSSAVSYPIFSPFTKTRRVSGSLPNGRSSGRRKDRRTIQNKNAIKRRAHRFNGAPALFCLWSLFLFPWASWLGGRLFLYAAAEMGIFVTVKINDKSEPIPYGERVRIILVWCRWRGSNPHVLSDNGF